MSYSLCLTLGHNASAILLKNGKVINGYENERLSGIKSDSQFPIHAMKELDKFDILSRVKNVYVSHWSTYGTVDEMSRKHWRKDLVNICCPNAEIHSLIPGKLTHHDAHVLALRSFTGEKEFEWEIVADGFGIFNEVISIYHNNELVHRCYGYEKSIGLLYQYTTAFLGMKMNQDEYKILGYEAHVREVCSPKEIKDIFDAVHKDAQKMLKKIITPELTPEFDAVAGLEALPNIRLAVRNHNSYILHGKLGYPKTISAKDRRIIMGYYVQSMVETVMVGIVDFFHMTNVALTGGVFMNVKINNVIAKRVGKISILPICGDLSCGLGVYQYYNGDLQWPKDLFLSKRDLSDFPINIPQTIVTNSFDNALSHVNTQLHNDKIVNFVYGNGEFGARALGHTTTFALPTMENVEYINKLNDRETTMPCAGMIVNSALHNYKDHYKVFKSLEYMIITLDLMFVPNESIAGAHHVHPVNGVYSNRVQLILNTSKFYKLLLDHYCLVNTSFNRHGVPIVLTVDQILDTHEFQLEADTDKRMITIICKGE